MSVDFSQLTKPSMVEEIDFESILAERKEKLISLFAVSYTHLTLPTILLV